MNGIKHMITAALKSLSSKGTIQKLLLIVVSFHGCNYFSGLLSSWNQFLSEGLLLLKGVALRV